MSEFWTDERTARYFGPPSMRQPHEEQVPTPVGQVCVLCEEAVVPGDLGTIQPGEQVMHYECLIRNVVGSVGHQNHTCSCFGGTEEDPPGMTLRQAAIAAATMHHESY